MASMSLFPFSLFELEFPLFINVSLFFGEGLAYLFILFLLKFQRLLRFGADTSILGLSSCFPQLPLGISGPWLHLGFNWSAIFQLIPIFVYKFYYLLICRLCSESHFAHLHLIVLSFLKKTDPERVFKQDGKSMEATDRAGSELLLRLHWDSQCSHQLSALPDVSLPSAGMPHRIR